MQRIISFGREYAQSAEFSVDEGQSIKFWLVREDHTTTIGESEAELQVKSAVGNDHWTTLEVLNDNTKPYYDLVGTDEDVRYRWVRKAGMPSFAIDRSRDVTLLHVQRAPVDVVQPDTFAATPVVFKALAGTNGDFVGLHYDYQLDDAAAFGAILGIRPLLVANQTPTSNSFIKFYRDTDADTLEVEFFEEISTGGAANTNWSDYDGGVIGFYTECVPEGDSPYDFNWGITAADITANGFALSIPTLGSSDGQMVAGLADGKTFFVYLKKPEQDHPVIDLGPRTGRFVLDENNIPARLTASPFDTSSEQVTLSAVEGNVVIPLTYNEDGDPIRLVSTFRGYTIVAPGEYEWERSCNSAPGVYLNPGWRA
jgi:hypothetical protein